MPCGQLNGTGPITRQEKRTHLIGGRKVDGLGRTIETDSPPPDAAQPGVYPVTKDSYDALGRLQSESVAQSVSNGTTLFSVTDYAYKATGDIDAPVTQEIEAAGSPQAITLTYSYDSAGNLVSESDGLGDGKGDKPNYR